MAVNLENLLRQVPNYENVGRLRTDISQLLVSVRTLRPCVNTFKNNNEQVVLFYLQGTVAINYNGTQYNIPMTIYFDPPFPRRPPRCFVTPTAQMAIKPRHKHVDSNGMVYLPYLNQWNEHTSKVSELVNIISTTFGLDPPVYSTGAGENSSVRGAVAQVAESAVSSLATSFNNLLGRSQPQAAFPAQPVVQGTAAQPQTQPAYAQPSGYAQPVQQAQPVSWGQQQAQGVQGQQPVQYAQPAQPSSSSGTVLAAPRTPSVEERKAAIIAELSQKVHAELTGRVKDRVKEVDLEIDQQDKLKSRGEAIDKALSSCESYEESVRANVDQLEKLKSELNEFIAAQAEGFDAAKVVEPQDALSKQLLDLICEDASLDDALHVADEAQRNSAIDVDCYLKTVRELSRQQFMCRQLKRKAIRALQAAQATAATTPVSAPVTNSSTPMATTVNVSGAQLPPGQPSAGSSAQGQPYFVGSAPQPVHSINWQRP